MSELADLKLADLEIIKYPDPRLSQVSAKVDDIGEPLRALLGRMFEIMYAAGGVGLAAPQVGVNIRVFIANPCGDPGNDEGVFINPEVLSQDGTMVAEEGCLSLPTLTCKIKRPARTTIRALDLNGQSFQRSGEGLLSRIFQHEMDHLNGVLLTDKMSIVARMSNRRLLQELEENYNAARPG